jgi:hypothetical protein
MGWNKCVTSGSSEEEASMAEETNKQCCFDFDESNLKLLTWKEEEEAHITCRSLGLTDISNNKCTYTYTCVR